MATAQVLEMARLGKAQGAVGSVGSFDGSSVVQNVTFTTSTQSSAFASTTNFISVRADTAAAYISVGSNPTATANSWKIAADTVFDFAVNPGDKIAFYDGSS